MVTLRPAAERGSFDGIATGGWLDTRHTFSFARYDDPAHKGFRSLRVINEDRVAPGRGFGTHGHENMEIISLVMSGRLAHEDSMGNGASLGPGEVQYMSAGSGVQHSEFNGSDVDPAHFYQIWIQPDRLGEEPRYAQTTLDGSRRQLLAAPDGDNAPIPLRQDARLWHVDLPAEDSETFDVAPGRAFWIQVLSGSGESGGVTLSAGDGLASEDETSVKISAGEGGLRALVFDLT